jgi:hypothetical protein
MLRGTHYSNNEQIDKVEERTITEMLNDEWISCMWSWHLMTT